MDTISLCLVTILMVPVPDILKHIVQHEAIYLLLLSTLVWLSSRHCRVFVRVVVCMFVCTGFMFPWQRFWLESVRWCGVFAVIRRVHVRFIRFFSFWESRDGCVSVCVPVCTYGGGGVGADVGFSRWGYACLSVCTQRGRCVRVSVCSPLQCIFYALSGSFRALFRSSPTLSMAIPTNSWPESVRLRWYSRTLLGVRPCVCLSLNKFDVSGRYIGGFLCDFLGAGWVTFRRGLYICLWALVPLRRKAC